MSATVSQPLRELRSQLARMQSRCLVCGRFMRYPQDACCDIHCARCICTECPMFRQPPEKRP